MLYTFWYLHVLYAIKPGKPVQQGELICLPTGAFLRVVQVYADLHKLDATLIMRSPEEHETVYSAVLHVSETAQTV